MERVSQKPGQYRRAQRNLSEHHHKLPFKGFKMSELDPIKQDYIDTKVKLEKAEKDKDFLRRDRLEVLLTKQTGVWENLLVIQGEFQLLSLHIALSIPFLQHL